MDKNVNSFQSKSRKYISPEKLERIAEILKAISHPVRLEIIELLEERGTLCVSEITTLTNIEQSLISHHLTKLKDRGILSSQRDGKKMLYSLEMNEIPKIFDCMSECFVI